MDSEGRKRLFFFFFFPEPHRKAVLYSLTIFHFTGHLLVTRTSSRAKLFLHQAYLNPDKSRMHVQSPRVLKKRNSKHFSKTIIFFTPQNVDCAKKNPEESHFCLSYTSSTLKLKIHTNYSEKINRLQEGNLKLSLSLLLFI